jgi:hypothetical protein
LAHTKIIMNQPSITKEWPLWMRYCIAVRQRCIQQGVDVSVFQAHIFNAVKTSFNRDHSDATSLAYINSEFTRRFGQESAHPRIQGVLQPNPAATTLPRTLRQPTTSSRNTQGSSCCFICGSGEHTSTACASTSSTNGGKLLASRTALNAPWTIGGKPFCYKFNGTRGCNFKACTNAHICSLCGSTGHDAQSCHH